eukprot:6974004-Karenia_brevis.AAC.1
MQFVAGAAPRDLVTAAMDPLPAQCLGVFITANSRFPAQERVGVVRRALRDVHSMDASEEAVQFIFEKLESHVPRMLLGLPADTPAPIKVWPAVHECVECELQLGCHAKMIPLEMYSTAEGRSDGWAVEQHCD